MKSVFSLVAVIILTGNSCKKDTKLSVPDNPYGLPNATQTGANIFAYLKDGVPQIVSNSSSTLGGGVRNDTLFVTGEAGDYNYFETIGIAITDNVLQGNTYHINPQTNFIKLVTNKNCFGYLGSNVIASFAVSGSIYLSKVDIANKIISGLFNCKIPIPNCDTLNITEGRFDIRYY